MQFELPLQDADHAGFAREFPGLGACRQAIFSLPHELQSGLGDDLPPMRVPQTLLLAAYPKGASYRRHFDSYAGRDIPRLLTVLLYLAWEPATGGHLRVYDPTTPEAAASERIIMRGGARRRRASPSRPPARTPAALPAGSPCRRRRRWREPVAVAEAVADHHSGGGAATAATSRRPRGDSSSSIRRRWRTRCAPPTASASPSPCGSGIARATSTVGE